MRRLRLRYTLSSIQLLITAILTFWADRVDWLKLGENSRIPPPHLKVHMAVIGLREIWRAINAPLFPMNQFGPKPFSILGFGLFELIYIFSVALLWYYVGRAYEGGRSDISPRRRRALGWFFVAWGIVMLLLAGLQLPAAFPWTFAYGRIFQPVGLFIVASYLAWSTVLIVSGAKKLRYSR